MCSTCSTPVGRPAFARARGEALGAERRLRGMLEHDRIAGEQGRNHAVDRDQVRIIPGRDRQHHAKRFAPHEALEVELRPRIDVGERVRGNRDHVPRTFERAAYFVGRVADRPTHLPGQFLRDRVALFLEKFAEARQQRDAAHERDGTPGALRLARGSKRRVDFEWTGKRSLGVDTSINR